MKNKKYFRYPVVVAVFTLSVVAAAFAADDHVGVISAESVQSAIAAKGAHWKSKSSWVSRLPAEEIRRILGVQDVATTDAEFTAPMKAARDAASVDWRNKDGVNWVSPILNQGNCGSCVAFATVATLETQVNVTSGIPGLNPSFSTQALFACGGGACEFGWQPSLAARFLTDNGVPDEACAPYTMGATGETVSCNSICSDSTQRAFKIARSSQPSSGTRDIDSVKEALKHGPLITTLLVYADFLTYSSGVYTHVTGTALGGHAISIVGFDDSTRSWIIRNSWGTEWGEQGFAHVSWDDISGVSDQTWALEVPSTDGYVTVRNPHGRAFVSGSIQLEADSTYPKTSQVEISILGDSGQSVKNFTCSASPCLANFDTTALSNGRYEVIAKATWSGGTATSQHEQFLVFNGTPHLQLSFTGADGADLSKPLSDRVVFNVVSDTGSTVPLTSVSFHVKNATSDTVAKTTLLVLPQMTMGWRTGTVPNGQYDIYLVGTLKTNSQESTVESQHYTVTVKNN